jgi:DNA topoisomerase-1
MTILVIVESPAKCKKIEHFCGVGYKCVASYGHLRHINSLDSINLETFETKYEIIDDARKRKQVETLR